MARLAVLVAAAALAGCSEPPDGYDVSKMDLKPAAAQVSAQRHTGPFASGASLSMGAEMLDTDPDAKAMLKEYNNLPMPNQSLSEKEISQYLKYFRWIDAQPAGSVAAPTAGH